MPAANLAAWDIQASGFPARGALADKARFAVGYAILAPSSHNTQPWQFVVTGGQLLVCADRTRSLPNIDPYDRELVISCGAALFNLRVAFAHFGVGIEIGTFPRAIEPDVLAQIALSASGPLPRDIGDLIDAISRRATNRGPFAHEQVPDALIEEMRAGAAAEGAELGRAVSLAERERVAALIAQADRRQFDDPRFRRELASWIHPARRNDGMPAFSQGLGQLGDAATPIAAMVLRTFDLGNGVAAAHEELARGSPLLVCLATPMDDGEAWLAAGQALQRLLLITTRAGYAASYLNQPIEVPELRNELGRIMALTGHPQLLLRIGRGAPVPHAPRRPLADVLV
jgi:hypothetical protein